jgi:hypothetical protein
LIDVTLDPLPNQTVSLRLGDRLYTLTLKETRGVMSIDIIRDGAVLVSGLRLVAGTPVIPYRYLEDGNFILFTDSGDLPEYGKFGATQSLVYLTAEELAEVRA